MDEWHLSLDRDHGQEATQGGGGVSREPDAEVEPWWRRFESLVDVDAEPRSWGPGVDDGRRGVDRRLSWLPADWRVVPDITTGFRGIRLDHLVIGPAGVFGLTVRSLDARTAIDRDGMPQNRRARRLLDRVRNDATRTRDRLTYATGLAADVRPVIVLVQSGIDLLTGRQEDAPGVTLMLDRDVPGWFLDQPGNVLAPGEVLQLELAARDADTWHRRSGYLG